MSRKFSRLFSLDIYQAVIEANSPSQSNPFATINDTISSWSPPHVTLNDFLNTGVTNFFNTSSGYHKSFDKAGDDEMVCNIALNSGVTAYDGSDLAVIIYWQLFSAAPGGGDTVKWEMDYTLLTSGGTLNAESLVDGNLVDSIDISTRDADKLYSNQLSTMVGKTLATHLQFTLRRNSQGAGADSYNNAADVYAIKLIIV